MVSRSEIEFEKHMLEEKKGKFEKSVLRASITLGLSKSPKVKFYEGYCPHGGGNDEWAHIHWDKGIICVSESMLKKMSYEKIEETATHEVTHMLEHVHDDNFYIKMDETMQADWEPPQGIIVPEGKNKKKIKSVFKEDKTLCNYHLCRKETKLERCRYCKGYFCKEHISPKMPMIREMFEREKNPFLADLYEKEWRRKDGHPDVVFSEIKLKEIAKNEKDLSDKIMKALDKIREMEFFEEPESKEKTLGKPYKVIHVDLRGSYEWIYTFETEEIAKDIFKSCKNEKGNIIEPRKDIIGGEPEITLHGKSIIFKYERRGSDISIPEKIPSRIPVKSIIAIILLFIIVYAFFTYNKEIMNYFSMLKLVKGCTANFTKAYESTATFGRDPSLYCKKVCSESYNSTIYKVIEPNQTSKLTICWCDVNNCNT